MKNKICILICIFTLLLSVSCFANAYENIETINIAKGVTLNKLTIFDENGWTYLNVIEININEKSVSIGPLISEVGVSHFSTIKNMVTNNNAVAGINGDYFAKRPNTTNRGQSIGFLGSDNQILVSSADENISSQTMGSFILSDNNNVIYSYLTDTITITSPKTQNTFEACDINKYVPYNSIGIYTSKWSNLSIGNSEGKEIVEVVVENNIVKEIRQYLEPTTIPKNGYILSAYGPDAIKYILSNFEVKDKVEYKVELNLDLDKMKFAISGGTMLVQNGDIPAFTHIIWGNNEMSAIGTNKNNSTIYLVSCTAKNGNKIGISQKHFAEVLKEYGIYNALCLDGGGSTTMITQQLGTSNISTILSGQAALRPVANGIGVFTNTLPTGKLSKLSLNLSSSNLFIGNSISFDISAFDTNYYAMDIDYSKLNISFSNSNAKYENGKIIGIKEGHTKLTVQYLGKKVTKDIYILADISKLEISPKESNISINDNITFSLIATSKNGFTDTISNEIAKWEIVNGNGLLENGTYTPQKHETVIISATINNVTVYAKININKEVTETFDSFEILNGTFSAYPVNISDGKVDISKNKKKDGTYSLKLNYNFKNTDNAVRGAYFDYDTPLQLPTNISEIGIWIYNPKINKNSIKSQYIDQKGNTYIDILVEEMNWKGWKYIQFPSSRKISKISSIYVAQSNKEISNSSYIYIDCLTVTYLQNNETSISLPKDILAKDNDERILNNSNCITLIDRFKMPSTLFDEIVNNKIILDINNNSQLLFTYNDIPQNILDNINVDNKVVSDYYVTDIKDLRIICINNSKNGIRATDYSQWENLMEEINTRKNILLILSNPIDTFTDSLEQELLINTLLKKSQNSKCWIVQYGSNTNIDNFNGIKVITIGNIYSNKSIEEVLDNYRYINIYVNSTDISYEIKEIF